MLKTAIVTGGSSGIGYAISSKLLDEGYTVFILSRNAKNCDLKNQPKCKLYNIDLTDLNQINELTEKIQSDYPVDTIDILVNCAGIGFGTPIDKLDEGTFDKVMNINVKAVFFTTKYFLPLMKKGGVICNISSIAGIKGFSEWTTYCASKFAIEGFTKALRDEVRGRGIRVVAVRPGAVNTPLYHFVEEEEKKDFISPETIAQVVVPSLLIDEKACVEEIFINNSIGDI